MPSAAVQCHKVCGVRDRACRESIGSAVILLLLLFLMGCSSLRVRPAVKIGLVAPFEGRYRYIGYDVIYAARLAIREANAAGGVQGYSVELVAYDDGGDPVMADEQARKLATDPELIAAVGHFRTDTTVAALESYAQAGIPLVAPGLLSPLSLDGTGDSTASVFLPGPSVEAVAGALLARLSATEGRVALVTTGGPLGAAILRTAPDYAVVITPTVSPHDPDWRGRVLTSGGAEAKAILCDADPVTAGEVALALREYGWSGVLLGGPEMAFPDFAAVAGSAADGAVFVTPWPYPSDIADHSAFVTAYQALGPHVPPPGSLALPTYVTFQKVLTALARDIATHQTPTRAGMATVLSEMTWGESGSDSLYAYRYRYGPSGVSVAVEMEALR